MAEYHCTCDPHGDNAKCNRECCQPRESLKSYKEITTDFADGFRTGFEAARREIEQAVEQALTNYTSVRKAIKGVKAPAAARELTGLEYRGG